MAHYRVDNHGLAREKNRREKKQGGKPKEKLFTGKMPKPHPPESPANTATPAEETLNSLERTKREHEAILAARAMDARIHAMLDDIHQFCVLNDCFARGVSHAMWTLFILWHIPADAQDIRDKAGPYTLQNRDLVLSNANLSGTNRILFLPRDAHRRSRSYYPSIYAPCNKPLPNDIVELLVAGEFYKVRREIIARAW